ncbi:MAG: class I SAM-dependent methyltransferase [Acidobacteria bacterium]|nr:class I SAM-dependent methyltransferase [Acidobacteriota bacterium]MCB9399402.1 class I SAM-dependent methyltransferase [Acidobacteriota bacterium]
MFSVPALVLALFIFPGDIPDYIQKAVSNPARLESDRSRDANRKPQEILTFVGVKPGDKVVDLSGGTGYYTAILDGLVGEKGHVYLHNVPFVLEKFSANFGPGSEFETKSKSWQHVTRINAPFDEPQLPKDLDMAMMVLFYHDTIWQGADRQKMNRAIFEALKPGGVFVVIDHVAESGSEARDVQTLHRIDPTFVKKEIMAAGFEFVAESELLRHPEDGHDYNVFRDYQTNRDHTDRFVFKFRKPKE